MRGVIFTKTSTQSVMHVETSVCYITVLGDNIQ